MLFKDASYLELCRPSFSVEGHRFGDCGRGHYEENFYEIILFLGQWFRRCRLSKEEGNYQESIRSSTIPDPGYQ